MPLPETEPNVVIRDLLLEQWVGANVEQTFKPAWVSTGWWDDDTPNPQITLTTATLPTSPDGIAADGRGLSSWVDGEVDINVWVPYDTTREYSTGQAKDFRWALTHEVHRIIENNQQGHQMLSRLTTGEIRRNPSDEPPPFRMLIPTRFQYRTAPE